MTVQSQLRGIKRPIAFIPTYLGYEHVSEVGNYMRELNGESKKKRKCSFFTRYFLNALEIMVEAM